MKLSPHCPLGAPPGATADSGARGVLLRWLCDGVMAAACSLGAHHPLLLQDQFPPSLESWAGTQFLGWLQSPLSPGTPPDGNHPFPTSALPSSSFSPLKAQLHPMVAVAWPYF